MTYHLAQQRAGSIIHLEALTGPNDGPGLASPSAMVRLADAMNYAACRQKKLVAWRAQNFRAVTGGSSAAINIWPFFFRTGEVTSKLIVYAGLVQTPFAAASPPQLRCRVIPGISGGTAVNATNGEGTIYFDAASAGATVTASEVTHKRFVITGLSADTEYRIVNECTNGMCVVYMVIYEAPSRHADDTVAGVCGTGKYQAQGPIYDEHIADLVDANNRLWKHNGAHLLSWACDYEAQSAGVGVPVITVNTSYTDVYSRDFYIATLYHNTRRRTTAATQVPVVMAVHSERTGGTGTLDVRLYDGTNSIEVTGIADSGAIAWVKASGTLPAQLANYRLQAKQSNGTTTHRIYGVSLFEYES